MIKYNVNVDEGSLSFFQTGVYYKSNYFQDLDKLTQDHKLIVLDLLLLHNCKNFQSADKLYRLFYRTYGKADYKTVNKRLKYLHKKNIMSRVFF